MFYKYENGEWLSGNEIHFPDGTVLNSENKESKDGWFWSENEPEDYALWVAQLQEFKP